MKDTGHNPDRRGPRRPCRVTEARESLIQSLAVRSIQIVKSDQDALWRYRVRPVKVMVRELSS